MNLGPQSTDVLAFMHFFKKPDCILTFEGKTFSKSDCKQLGEGSEKTVFSIKGDKHCFFVPTKNPNNWDMRIQVEKELCDEILSVGLKAQQFDIVPLEVQEKAGGPKYTINVLKTLSFDSIANDNSAVIYNPKGAPRVLTGKPFTIYDNVKRLQDKQWNFKIIKEIIKEYAIALTFRLPIHQVKDHLDDSVHFYIELPKSENEPPVFHYMFWDVCGDFSGLKPPIVPTLTQLKDGLKDKTDPKKGFWHIDPGLKTFVNEMVCAYCSNPQEYEKFGYAHSLKAVIPFMNALYEAITDEVLLEAIEAARKCATQYLEKSNAKKQVPYLPAFAATKAAKDNGKDKLIGDFFEKYGLGEPNEEGFLAALRIFKDSSDLTLLFGSEFKTLLKEFNIETSNSGQGSILNRGLAAVEASVGKDLKMTDEKRASVIKELVQIIYQKKITVKQACKVVSY